PQQGWRGAPPPAPRASGWRGTPPPASGGGFRGSPGGGPPPAAHGGGNAGFRGSPPAQRGPSKGWHR
ncbi:MAG TPA: hypothetical protein VIQ54_01900, partial [Polyangia bacterium]